MSPPAKDARREPDSVPVPGVPGRKMPGIAPPAPLSIDPEVLRAMPVDVKKWMGYALAFSMAAGTVTGSVIAIVQAVNGTAKSEQLDKVIEGQKTQGDAIARIEKRLTEKDKRDTLQDEQLERVADLGAQLNAGQPAPRWPFGVVTWEPPPREGTRVPIHKTPAPWPLAARAPGDGE